MNINTDRFIMKQYIQVHQFRAAATDKFVIIEYSNIVKNSLSIRS